MTLIRVCDSRVLIIICKTPHKMNCFNQRSGNDKIVVVGKPTIKTIMQRTESKSWSGKNDIVPRTPRFSNHVVKGGMKTTLKGSPAAREPIVNKTRNTSQITEDNTVKTTGNRSTNIGDLIMPRIRNRSSKDFVTKNK